jgi:O-antigen/teichoic acid export membrane protein
LKRPALRPRDGSGAASEPAVAAALSVTPRRAFADVAAQLGGQVVNLALGIVTTIVIVRALGTTLYGQWATILALIELVGLVGNFGIETVAVRFAAQDPEREGWWVGAATSLRLAVSLPVLVVFVVVMALLAGSHEMRIAGLILSLLYLTAALSTLRIVFRLHVRNHITTAFSVANSVLWTASVIVIAAADGGLVPFALAFAGTAIVVQTATAVAALRTMRVHWHGVRRFWPRLFKVGLAVGIAGTLTYAYGRIDQVIVYELAPHASEVGVYAAMYKVLENAAFVPVAVMTTLFPIMAGLFPGEPQRLRRIVQMAIDYLTMIALGGLALTLAASGPIVELLFGSAYSSGATILPILFGAFVPICIGNVAGNMVIATDLQKRYIWYAALGLLLNAPLNLVLVPTYGVQAAAWITLATELVVVSLTLLAVLRKIEMSLALRRIALATLAATGSGLAVWGLREAGLGAVALIVAMGVLYPLALLGLRALDLGELRAVIRTRREARPA